MNFVFSLDADALTWPPTTHGGPVEAGGLVAGPEGLLRVVETALGLGGPAVPAVRRIAIWRAKLAAVDHPGRFWHRSFQEDPFATARLLLGWRDSLVDAGWHADALSDPPRRPAALSYPLSCHTPPTDTVRLRGVSSGRPSLWSGLSINCGAGDPHLFLTAITLAATAIFWLTQ